MNKNIEKLFEIYHKEKRMFIGLMSGTSYDGLDIVLSELDKNFIENKRFNIIQYDTVNYDTTFKKTISNIISKDKVLLKDICFAHRLIAETHTKLVLDFLTRHQLKAADIDCIASHGQTIYHYPDTQNKTSTLQIGDGDFLSYLTGIVVVSDFRQKNIAAGGQGAPLAPYADFMLFRDEIENRILLNIGGIANITSIHKQANFSDVISFDTGPGNGIMDAFISSISPDKSFDSNGDTASKGRVNESLLHVLLSHHYFDKTSPKSTGKELFNLDYLNHSLKHLGINLSTEDCLATLNMFTAKSIYHSISSFVKEKDITIYVDGGGRRNKTLVKNLKMLFKTQKIILENPLKIPSDIKEAFIFSTLANETFSPQPFRTFDEHPYLPRASMGKISLPF